MTAQDMPPDEAIRAIADAKDISLPEAILVHWRALWDETRAPGKPFSREFQERLDARAPPTHRELDDLARSKFGVGLDAAHSLIPNLSSIIAENRKEFLLSSTRAEATDKLGAEGGRQWDEARRAQSECICTLVSYTDSLDGRATNPECPVHRLKSATLTTVASLTDRAQIGSEGGLYIPPSTFRRFKIDRRLDFVGGEYQHEQIARGCQLDGDWAAVAWLDPKCQDRADWAHVAQLEAIAAELGAMLEWCDR